MITGKWLLPDGTQIGPDVDCTGLAFNNCYGKDIACFYFDNKVKGIWSFLCRNPIVSKAFKSLDLSKANFAIDKDDLIVERTITSAGDYSMYSYDEPYSAILPIYNFLYTQMLSLKESNRS